MKSIIFALVLSVCCVQGWAGTEEEGEKAHHALIRPVNVAFMTEVEVAQDKIRGCLPPSETTATLWQFDCGVKHAVLLEWLRDRFLPTVPGAQLVDPAEVHTRAGISADVGTLLEWSVIVITGAAPDSSTLTPAWTALGAKLRAKHAALPEPVVPKGACT